MPVEHLGAGAVGEVDVVEADVAADVVELARSRLVGDLRLLHEHLHDLVERRDRREERAVELRELLHRVEEGRRVAEERGQDADRRLPVEDEVGAVAEDDRGRERREQVDEREVDGVLDDRLLVALPVGLADPAEVLARRALARERLEDAHAGDVLGERRRDRAERLADSAVRAARLLAEDRPSRRRAAGITTSVASASFHERRNRITAAPTSVSVFWISEVNAVGDELVERLDVVRDPADQDAGAVALVEAEREPLQVAEEVVAEVGEHALARPAGEVGLRVGAGDADDADRDEQRDDELERPVRGVPLTMSTAAADQDRRHERGGRRREQRRDRRQQCATCTASRAGRARSAAASSPPTTSRRPAPSGAATSVDPGCQTVITPTSCSAIECSKRPCS